MTGYVYAIGNDECVKIGFSTAPELRRRQIRSHSTQECNLFGYVEATLAQEQELHSLLSPYRMNREWYRRGSDAVEALISSVNGRGLDGDKIRRKRSCDIVELVGGPVALSQSLSRIGRPISSQAISQWRRVPAARTLEVETATGISRTEIRPDLYPSEEVA